MLSKKQENNRTLITAPLTLAWREKEREFDLILHFIFELLQAFQFSLLQNKTRSITCLCSELWGEGKSPKCTSKTWRAHSKTSDFLQHCSVFLLCGLFEIVRGYHLHFSLQKNLLVSVDDTLIFWWQHYMATGWTVLEHSWIDTHSSNQKN